MSTRNYFKMLYDKVKEQGKIEDEDGIIEIIPPNKVSLTPKDETKLDELYERMIIKLQKKGLLRYCACYKENGKIILQAV